MQNFNLVKIEKLQEQSENFFEIFNKSDQWVDSFLKYEEKETLSLKIKHGRRIIRKIKESIGSKPVFALFGASQVGKSYLVKNLLSIKGAPLEINSGQHKYDFLKDINPPGTGAESTGVVTRFSIDSNFIDEKYPIRIKLLDVKDLIIIICDSFFSDLKKLVDYPSSEKFAELIIKLDEQYHNKPTNQNILSEDDIWDIQDYFSKNFNKFSYYVDHINESSYWLKVGNLIKNIPVKEWVNVFSLLWSRNEYLSNLFSKLVDELEKISFAKTIYSPFDAVLRQHGEILDVQRLKEIFDDTTRLSILSDDRKEYSISISILSALSAELTLPISPILAETKSFLKQTDLLDFPGSRSRLDLTTATITNRSIPDMYLRGKIAYLFNKYSSNYEVNNLLFCTKDQILDVNEIPAILNNWICNNIGENPDEREKRINQYKISPLFIVFTFFNNQLKFDTTNDQDSKDLTYKWNNRFHRFFENEIVTTSYDWNKKWTQTNPLFDNFYLLRDFKYSDDTFLGFEKNNHELSVDPQRIEFIQKLRNSFIDFPFVKEHFKNPNKSWDAATGLNKDGSDLIIENLGPVANNFVKIKNYVEILDSNKLQLSLQLKKHLHSDNLMEKRKNEVRNGIILQLEFDKVFGVSPILFGKFIKQFCLEESEIYSYFHNNLVDSRLAQSFDKYTLFRSKIPDLNPENTYEQNIEILREKFFFTTSEEVVDFLNEKEFDLEKLFSNKINTSATVLVNGLFELWEEKLKYENLFFLKEHGLTRSTFESFLRILKTTITNLNLKEVLTELVEKKTKRLQLGRDAEEYLASVTTNYINDFISNFGFNFMKEERLAELKEIGNEFSIDVTNLLANDSSQISKNDLKILFDNQSNSSGVDSDMLPMITNFNNFIIKMKLALLSNCGFINYNVRANDELAGLINKIDSLDFNIS